MRRFSNTCAGLFVASLIVAGCSPHGKTSASSSASAGTPTESVAASEAPPNDGNPPWLGISKSPSDVAKVINAKGNNVYTGKTGTVRGTVTVTGDPPPEVPFHAERRCAAAQGYYDRLFRKADNGAVADALVAINGYDAFLPVDAPAKTVQISDCSFGTRTIVMTFGQRLEVRNDDTKESFMPFLDGTKVTAQRVAMPQGRPVKLYPERPGGYLLRDMLKHPYMIAHVFVLPNKTADVTGQDGHFEIKNVPVGKVKVTALLPMIDKKGVEKDLEVHEGDNDIEIELSYDKATDKPVAIPEAQSPLGPQ